MVYDFLIIGGGPAGLSAAIYASRFKLKTAIVSEDLGGVAGQIGILENYPGFYNKKGKDLINILKKQVKFYKVPIVKGKIHSIEKGKKLFTIESGKGELQAKAVLVATGSAWRKLDVIGAKKFEDKGVYYNAFENAHLFRNKVVGVVGGSDSAAKEALFLSKFAKKVYIIYRKGRIRAEPINSELVEKNRKIEVVTNSNVVELDGEKRLESAVLDTGKTLNLDGLFIEIGSVPNTYMLKKLGVSLNEKEEIIVDEDMKTSVEGLFAAGDVTNNPFKQIITAAYQGAVAAKTAYLYTKEVTANV